MPSEFDIVIRGGSIMDGNGGAPFVGDVAVRDGRIAEVGKVSGGGCEENDAGGVSVNADPIVETSCAEAESMRSVKSVARSVVVNPPPMFDSEKFLNRK